VKIDHIAIWVTDLERMRDFYLKYFNTTCGELYNNPIKRFNSYFITFYDGNSRIELMTRPDIVDYNIDPGLGKGYTHLAIAVGLSCFTGYLQSCLFPLLLLSISL
jgi:lactoylglutathione lyase